MGTNWAERNARATIILTPTIAITTPAAPPTTDRTTLSVSDCRISRAREAPKRQATSTLAHLAPNCVPAADWQYWRTR